MTNGVISIDGRNYLCATWRRRIAARFIGLGCAVALICAVPDLLKAILIVGVFPYTLISDGLWNGRNLGKRIIGLAVLDTRTGRPCSLIQDLVRNRRFFFFSLIVVAAEAYDRAEGNVPESPETCVVRAKPLRQEEVDKLSPPPERSAKLNLDGMRESVKKSLEKEP